MKLSALAIEKAAPPATGRMELHDAEVPGLVLRVSASGTRSWSFTYRFKGALTRLTLGQWPGLSLKEARERAREARGTVQRGMDPVQERRDLERERRLTFAPVVTDYIERYAKPHQRTWRKTESILTRLAVPAWGDLPLKDIHRRDVVDLLEAVARTTPYQANHLRCFLSHLFKWCIERELLDTSPLVGTKSRFKPQPRSRVLSDIELVALWRATQQVGGAFGAATRLLLLTGMRRQEVAALRWDEIQDDWANLPASRMKNGRNFRAPLSATAKALICAQPKVCEYVFTTTGGRPISGWGKAKKRLDEQMTGELRAPPADWRIHDLRRTVASGLARLGYRTEVIKRVLAHVAKASDITTTVYVWHQFDEEALEAVNRWAAHLAKLTTHLALVPMNSAT